MRNGKQTIDRACVRRWVLWTPDGHCDLNSHEWFAWLENNNAFYLAETGVDYAPATFTARAEKRGNLRHWYAYSRVLGKLHKRYIGETSQVTWQKLVEIAQKMPTTRS